MLHDEPVRLGSGLGKSFLRHLSTLLDAPLQQEALVGFEQLQLVSLLQILPPKTRYHNLINDTNDSKSCKCN